MKLFVESEFKQAVIEGDNIRQVIENIQDEFNDCLLDLKFYNLEPMIIDIKFLSEEG